MTVTDCDALTGYAQVAILRSVSNRYMGIKELRMEILIFLAAFAIVALIGAAAVTFGTDSRDANTKTTNAW